MEDRLKFLYLFWFCVGVFVLSFLAMMSLLFFPVPEQTREMAANTQGFLQGSLIMSAVGFLLTGSITTNMGKKPDTKTTTEITPEGGTLITTEPANTHVEQIKSPEDGPVQGS